MPLKPALITTLIATAVVLAACSPAVDTSGTEPETPTTTRTPATTTGSVTASADPIATDGETWTVSGPVSGNRVLQASGDIQGQAPVDVVLDGIPQWVVGVPGPDGLVWVVALEDGRLQAWQVENSEASRIDLNLSQLPPGTPPVVVSTAQGVSVVVPPADASPLSYPLPIGDDGLAYVTTDGLLVVQTGSSRQEYDIAALPDARISQSDDGLLAVLAGATDRYAHGVLGDELEASSVVIIDPLNETIVGEAVIDEPSVIEGLAGLWADVDGNGTQEILVTVSDGEVGAGLVVFDRTGDRVAAGPPIGRGNRWRNQLGAGPTGPNGEIEIVDVRVPHIGGVVEYFRTDGDELVFQTQQQGQTSHVYGSRNLDMAIAFDVTGDGNPDVVVPNQELTALSLLTRTGDGVSITAELPLAGRLTTNLAAGIDQNGTLSLAIGTSDGVLRIWPSG